MSHSSEMQAVSIFGIVGKVHRDPAHRMEEGLIQRMLGSRADMQGLAGVVIQIR